jgi:hypothetical protein
MLGITTSIPALFAMWYGFAKQNVPATGQKIHSAIRASDLISGSFSPERKVSSKSGSRPWRKLYQRITL